MSGGMPGVRYRCTRGAGALIPSGPTPEVSLSRLPLITLDIFNKLDAAFVCFAL